MELIKNIYTKYSILETSFLKGRKAGCDELLQNFNDKQELLEFLDFLENRRNLELHSNQFYANIRRKWVENNENLIYSNFERGYPKCSNFLKPEADILGYVNPVYGGYSLILLLVFFILFIIIYKGWHLLLTETKVGHRKKDEQRNHKYIKDSATYSSLNNSPIANKTQEITKSDDDPPEKPNKLKMKKSHEEDVVSTCTLWSKIICEVIRRQRISRNTLEYHQGRVSIEMFLYPVVNNDTGNYSIYTKEECPPGYSVDERFQPDEQIGMTEFDYLFEALDNLVFSEIYELYGLGEVFTQAYTYNPINRRELEIVLELSNIFHRVGEEQAGVFNMPLVRELLLEVSEISPHRWRLYSLWFSMWYS